MNREGHSLPGKFFLPTKSMLDNNILFEKSIYDTISKTSDRAPLTQRSFPHPAQPTGQQSIDPPSSEKEDILGVLPSALVPRITESTSSPFLMGLGRDTQTKAAPTATHTEQPSLLGLNLRLHQDKVGHKAQVHNEGLWQYRIGPSQSVYGFLLATYRLTIDTVCSATCVSLAPVGS